MSNSDPTDIVVIWNQIKTVVIGSFFATFIFDALDSLDNRLEVGIATLSVFGTYMVVDRYLRPHLPEIWSVQGNVAWQQVLKELMSAMVTLGVFLIIQYVLLLISNFMTEANLSISETFLALYSIALITFSTLQSLIDAK